MDLPTLKSLQAVYPKYISKFKDLINDPNVDVDTKINSIIQGLNSTNLTLNQVINNWNQVMQWAMNDGLDASVLTHMNEIVSNGTFQSTLDNITSDSQNLKNQYILVDDYSRQTGETDDSQRIGRAIADGVTKNKPIKFGSSTYYGNILIASDNVELIGSGRPVYDETTGNFIKIGTILNGTINFQNHKHIKISKLGIDARSYLTTGMDGALTSGDTLSMNPIWHHVEDVACIGNGYQSDMTQNFHAMLFQSGTEITVKDVFLFNWYHGLALRAGEANVNGVYAWQCGGTSVIVKSASGGNDTVKNVNIDNVNIYGSTLSAYNRGGQIHVQSYNTGCLTQHVNISNVVSTNGGTACILVEQVAGQCSNVTVVNAKASNCGDVNTRSVFDVSNATDVRFINCDSVGATGYAYRNSGGSRIRVFASFAGTSGVSDYNGNFDYLELNNSVLSNIFDNLNLDKNIAPKNMEQGLLLTGQGTANVGTASNLLSIAWQGVSGQYTGLMIDIYIMCNAGGVSQAQKFRIAGMRDGTTTIKANLSEDGTMVSSGSALGSITISLDTSTANTLNVKITGNTYAMTYGYMAHILTDSGGRGLWQIQNLAS